MTKKLFLILLVSNIIIIFNSCTNSSKASSPVVLPKDGFVEDVREEMRRIETVVECINTKNKEPIIELYSEQALSEATNLDEDLDRLFSLFEEPIQSYESGASTSGGRTNSEGVVEDFANNYLVKSGDLELNLFLSGYAQDTINPENVGLYMIQIFRPEDEMEQFDFGNKKKKACILLPSDFEK